MCQLDAQTSTIIIDPVQILSSPTLPGLNLEHCRLQIFEHWLTFLLQFVTVWLDVHLWTQTITSELVVVKISKFSHSRFQDPNFWEYFSATSLRPTNFICTPCICKENRVCRAWGQIKVTMMVLAFNDLSWLTSYLQMKTIRKKNKAKSLKWALVPK